MLMSAELKGFVTWLIYFLDLLWVRYNCAKFHHCRICVTSFREGGLFGPPPHPWAAPKKPNLNRVNADIDIASCNEGANHVQTFSFQYSRLLLQFPSLASWGSRNFWPFFSGFAKSFLDIFKRLFSCLAYKIS